jgi:hypothetical protein
VSRPEDLLSPAARVFRKVALGGNSPG